MRKYLYKITNRVIDLFFYNLYIKPRNILKICVHPSVILGRNYYPELPQKSKLSIFFDQVWNILLSGEIDKYYYLYALNVKGFRNRKDYVLYHKPFAVRRDELNLSGESNSSCILRNKLYFGIFAKAIGIETPTNIAYIYNGDVLLLDKAIHTNIDDFVVTHQGIYFCKPLAGECGTGVFKLEIDGKHLLINNTLATVEKLGEYLDLAPFIIQQCIEQHPLQKQLHPASINSIRLVTVRSLKDGHIAVLPSILRIGTGASIVDNTSQGGIAVGFDLDTGRLNDYGLYKPQFGLLAEVHPDSGIRFSEYSIPYIRKVIEQAKYFHSFLDLHSIGWDIAIGEAGPIFIEGNDNWEINGPQSCNRGLAKEFKELFYK